MTKDMAVYTAERVRTLSSLQSCARLPKSHPTHQRLGVQHPPILKIGPNHVVPDELHLLLRIGDVLIRNLVFQMLHQDQRCNRTVTSHPSRSHLQLLQQKVKECGVTFRVWQKRDSDGKLSGTYDWTSLMGTDMKKVLKHLPFKFGELLEENLQATTSQIWTV